MRGLSPVPQKIPNFSGEADGCHGRFEDNEVKLFIESCQSDPWYFLLTCDRSSSSSATSPARRVPSSNFFYLRKLGALRQPISFEDSPYWEESDVEVRVEESGDGGDSINTATTPISPSLSKLNSGSMPSPPDHHYHKEGWMIQLKHMVKYSSLEQNQNCNIDPITPSTFWFFYQKKSVVDDAILAISLGDYANKLIGGHCYMKGLPSGEKRRVSIERKLLMRPQVLFIDEPLHQLGSWNRRGFHHHCPPPYTLQCPGCYTQI